MGFRSFSTHIKEGRGLLEQRHLTHLPWKKMPIGILWLWSQFQMTAKITERPQTGSEVAVGGHGGEKHFSSITKNKSRRLFSEIREADVTNLRQREGRNPCAGVTLIPCDSGGELAR